MERLTIIDEHGDVYVKHHDYTAAARKLAAYEDIGLEPDEIRADKWIPVSERMPSEYKPECTKSAANIASVCKMVNVTVKELETGERWTSQDFTKNGVWVNHNNHLGEKIIAWMPLLPEPYKEGE